MVHLFFVVENAPADATECLAVGFLLDLLQLVDEGVPFGRVTLNH